MPRAEPYPWHVVSAHTEQVGSGYLVSRWCQRRPWITVWETPPGRHPAKPRLSHVSAYVFAGNPHPASSRIRPANDRETSRNDGDGWSIESAGQRPDSGIVAGSEIGPENTLKVETRVQIPLGLQPQNPTSGH